jgi:hypothetical protein
MIASLTSTRPTYPAPLRNWETFSWIRSKPVQDGSYDGQPFPKRLVPIAADPRITAHPGLDQVVLAYRLLSHLHFTTLLELAHVNPVCQELAMGQSPVTLTTTEKNDALRIYCDEGGHALFVELLATRIESMYGVDRKILGRPEFDERMASLLAAHSNPADNTLLKHFFVTVSETLVTRILREIPYDVSVAPVVRSTIGDHAADEACHSVFFRWYFPRLWEALSAREQSVVSQALPEFIWAFLAPDFGVDARILKQLGFDTATTAQMLQDAHPPASITASIRHAARPTLDMMRTAGVFELPEARDRFREMGLLE